MKADWIKARQTKYSAYITVYILVILAVLGVANFLANRYDKSYDSTANKQFSLSDQTVKAVKGPEERRQRSLTSARPRSFRKPATCWAATPASLPSSRSNTSIR